MLVSKQWLQDFVFLPDSLTPEELARELTMKTVEVEGFEDTTSALDGIVVGVIKTVEDHPNADSLKVCVVDVGGEKLSIVCGGSNLIAGMKVALGKIGARVRWHGECDAVELKKTKIRGIESHGMICASDEIGLETLFPKQEEKEILDLGDMAHAPGTPLAEALGLHDVVFDIDNKSMTHRSDLWGHYGMAREVAAVYRKKLKPYKTKAIKAGSSMTLRVGVEDAALAPRYMAVALDGITVQSSPPELQSRLVAVGIRPVNLIVDITNYVMAELGQPMHAFDAARITEVDGTRTIFVRSAKDGERVTTLDDKEHVLADDTLVIADAKGACAIAGIMGGANSAITDATTSIIFESAIFDATHVRRSATALGIRTDSSARFEKGLDPAGAEVALRRAVELVLKYCPGAHVVSDVVDSNPDAAKTAHVAVPFSFLEEKIGVAIPQKDVIDILTRLGFGVKTKKDTLAITVPTWRATKDVAIPEDVVEEVARLYGYGNVPEALPTFPIAPPIGNALRSLERKMKALLAYEHAYTEVYNYSFVSPEWLSRLGIDSDNHIELDNPIAKDRPLLRRNLIPNLLQNVERNLHRVERMRLFEVGRTYRNESAGERVRANADELLPKQDTVLGMMYAAKGDGEPFFELAGAIRAVFTRLGARITLHGLPEQDALPSHPGRYAAIHIGQKRIGKIGELHPETQRTIGIPERTAMLEITLNAVLPCLEEAHAYNPLSVYPPIDRDIAFVVDRSVPHADIAAALAGIDPLVTDVSLFDVYEGNGVSEGKKSMAYHLVYRSDTRTLQAKDIDALHARLIEKLEKEFGARMR